MIAVFYDATPGVQPIDPVLKVALDISPDAKSIQKCLQSAGYETALVGLEDEVLNTFTNLKDINPDLIFNLCEGKGEDSLMESRIASLLELMGFSFTGSPSRSIVMCHDKSFAKRLLSMYQIPTPPFICINPGEKIDVCPIDFPVIVKPVHEDGSLGIEDDAVVNDTSALRNRVDRVHSKYKQAALAEQYIDGRELNFSILGNDPFLFINIREVKFQKGYKIVSFQGKWKETSKAYQSTPVTNDVEINTQLRDRLIELAKKCFKVFEMHDYGRIDVRLNSSGIPYVIDVNPNPCIAPDSGMAMAAEEEGFNYAQFVEKIVDLARERNHEVASSNAP